MHAIAIFISIYRLPSNLYNIIKTLLGKSEIFIQFETEGINILKDNKTKQCKTKIYTHI